MFFHTSFAGNEGRELRLFKLFPLWSYHFTYLFIYCTYCKWSDVFHASDWMASSALPPPPSPLWDFCRKSSSAITRKTRNFAITTWFSGSGCQAQSAAPQFDLRSSMRQLQSVTNAADTFPRCPHYISTKLLEVDLFMSAFTSGIFSSSIPSMLCFLLETDDARRIEKNCKKDTSNLSSAFLNYLAFLSPPSSSTKQLY